MAREHTVLISSLPCLQCGCSLMEFCNKRTKNIISQGVAMAEISAWWITTGWGILSYGPQTRLLTFLALLLVEGRVLLH